MDVPSPTPALGFDRIADALRTIVVESDPRFGIGIFGGWGSGKTTLMRSIQNLLRSSDVVTVSFNAWRYEKEEHLIVPLLDSIRESLIAWADSNGDDLQARRTATAIGRVMRSIVAGLTVKVGVPGAVDVSFDANRLLQEHTRLRKDDLEARVPRSF